jgi:hypothetical protein
MIYGAVNLSSATSRRQRRVSRRIMLRGTSSGEFGRPGHPRADPTWRLGPDPEAQKYLTSARRSALVAPKPTTTRPPDQDTRRRGRRRRRFPMLKKGRLALHGLSQGGSDPAFVEAVLRTKDRAQDIGTPVTFIEEAKRARKEQEAADAAPSRWAKAAEGRGQARGRGRRRGSQSRGAETEAAKADARPESRGRWGTGRSPREVRRRGRARRQEGRDPGREIAAPAVGIGDGSEPGRHRSARCLSVAAPAVG